MLNFERIKHADHPYFEEAFSIYKESFAIFERRTSEDQIRALGDKEYHFNLIKSLEGNILGILLYWDNEEFIYIEHFAISPTERGKKIGTSTLQHLKEFFNKPIVLEIEPPLDNISIKRKRFYEGVDFVDSKQLYTHRSYRKETKVHTLEVMSFPAISDNLFNHFKQFINARIMKYSEFNL